MEIIFSFYSSNGNLELVTYVLESLIRAEVPKIDRIINIFTLL